MGALWVVFTHLVVKHGLNAKRVVAGHDSQPGADSLPTNRWKKGWSILDEYQIKLPTSLTSGEYTLEIGLYQATGQRLPLMSEGITLGKVKIE